MPRNRLVHVLLAATAISLAGPAAHGSQFVPFTGKVDQPDVMGGYASTHVIVRVKSGVQPVRRMDGTLTFSMQPAQGAEPGLRTTEAQIAGEFARFDVIDIKPTAGNPPVNMALARQLGLDRYFTVTLPAGSDARSLAAALNRFEAHIELAETDGIGGALSTFANDPSFGVQYGLHNTGQVVQGQAGVADSDIDAPEAWDITQGSTSVIIAIIDTGVSASHPDLSANVITGYNVLDGSTNTTDSWLISHGTHCSGIASARGNNATGVSGVTWRCKIMPVKVLNTLGSGTETQCANGVIWAADHGAHVGSMSLGYPDGIQYFHDAIAYAHAQGMVLTAATGNTAGAQIFFPARWPETIAVGATDNRDQLASFTTTGPEMSVTAPGVDVYSTWAAFFTNNYSYQSGTSMACPHVAGLAALVFSANPALTNMQVRSIIESTADDRGAPGWDPQFGHGRVNAFQAVSAAVPPACIPADVTCDGVVNFDDVLAALAAWGPCPAPCPADVTGDGVVNFDDVLAILASWS